MNTIDSLIEEREALTAARAEIARLKEEVSNQNKLTRIAEEHLRAETDRLMQLEAAQRERDEANAATDALMEIVEGVRGERWSANGKRLVDTPEWCRFYVAWRKQ